MKYTKYLIFCLILSCVSGRAFPRTGLVVQSGYGYVEHFTLGAGIKLAQSHCITINYGTNFFIKMGDFSTYFLQYDYMFRSPVVRDTRLKAGLRSGYSVLTNEYYRWKVLSAVVYAGAVHTFSSKVDIYCDMGLCINRELSVQRISMGEIGSYRRYLPECKVGVRFSI